MEMKNPQKSIPYLVHCRYMSSLHMDMKKIEDDHVLLEHLHRFRHLAEFVAAVETGNRRAGIAGGQDAHGLGHGDDRPGNHPRHQVGDGDADDDGDQGDGGGDGDGAVDGQV